MGVLCDWELRARCEKGGMVIPFDENLLNPASLDVRLGDQLMVESIYSPELIRINISGKTEDEPFLLQPGEFCLGETLEQFAIPDDLCSTFLLKSSRAREGYDHSFAGFADPGWHGSKLTLEIKNNRLHHPLPLYPGLKIGQMVFHSMSNVPMRSYAEVGHYNGHLQVMDSVA